MLIGMTVKPMVNYHTLWGKVQDFDYLISIDGNMIRLERTVSQRMVQGFTEVTYPVRRLKTSLENGYVRFTMSKLGKTTRKFAHQLVLLTFHGLEELRPHVNHKNGIHNDNRIENLEWCTPKENESHAWKVLGKQHSKEANKRRSETLKEYHRIRKLK